MKPEAVFASSQQFQVVDTEAEPEASLLCLTETLNQEQKRVFTGVGAVCRLFPPRSPCHVPTTAASKGQEVTSRADVR